MKASLTKQYAKNEKLTVATALDPCFKGNFFTEQCVKDKVIQRVERLTRVNEQMKENYL